MSSKASKSLFTTTPKQWSQEIERRAIWVENERKTVEAAADKDDGLKKRAKHKRGGATGPASAFTSAYQTTSVSQSPRRTFPSDRRNPLLVGNTLDTQHKGGLKQINPEYSNTEKISRKQVETSRRSATLGMAPGHAFAILAGQAPADHAQSNEFRFSRNKGRKCFVEKTHGLGGEEDMRFVKGKRMDGRAATFGSDPLSDMKSPKEHESQTGEQVRLSHPQRYASTPSAKFRTHSFGEHTLIRSDPSYHLNPPYATALNTRNLARAEA